MIQFDNIEVHGWRAAIRGLRNPLNSWERSDSYETHIEDAQTEQTAEFEYFIGDADLDLMRRMNVSSEQSKYRRMIVVTLDIVAPLYWWKEYDTYKVGTVANSCSTMHTIHKKEFTLDDFSLDSFDCVLPVKPPFSEYLAIASVINELNFLRVQYNATGDKRYWRRIIQLLPSSYNQRRTVLLNYEVLSAMYRQRKAHKLDEWREFCRMIENLPYAEELITGEA